MQMTGDDSQTCPVCKMSNLTPLDSKGAATEAQLKKQKKAKRASGKPARNSRRANYRFASRAKTPRLRSVVGLIAGSAILSIVLSSTILGGPQNPLDARNFLKLRWDRLGMTPLTAGPSYEVGGYRFISDYMVDPEVSVCSNGICSFRAFIFNTASVPLEYPMANMCLKTKEAHYSGMARYVPTDPTLELINPGFPGADQALWASIFGPQVGASWILNPELEVEEIYYGTCGDPGSAWFRFKIP